MKLVHVDPYDSTLTTAYINIDYIVDMFTIDDKYYVDLIGGKQSTVTKEVYENILKYGKAD